MADRNNLVQEAKEGNTSTLGNLLEMYRHYLAVLARVQIGQRLQGKIDASDVVQETFMDAYKNFEGFRGETEAQFLGWLRQILANKLANYLRRYFGTQGRDIRLEREIEHGLDKSSMQLDGGLIAPNSTPSAQACHREQAVLLADALSFLPEVYRETILLRNFEGLSFPEIASRMDRSQDSVEKLWLRALVRLREIMEEAS